jgi:drug/metabolite transporter (DMT)-like permease
VAISLATAIIWAAATIVLAMGLTDGIDPVLVSVVRIPAVVVFSLLAAAQQGDLGEARHLSPATWGLLCAAGILGWSIGSSLYSLAVQMIGPGKAALISSTAPIFAVPMTLVFLKERPTRNTLIGTLITMGGIMLVIWI